MAIDGAHQYKGLNLTQSIENFIGKLGNDWQVKHVVFFAFLKQLYIYKLNKKQIYSS